MAWVEISLLIVAIILILCLAYLAFMFRKRYMETLKDLNNQTLDFHLRKIKEAGYDFVLKPSKNLKKPLSEGKQAKGKTFESLIRQ